MSTANELWLEDMSLKLLCVFALDRFGDFVTDEVRLQSSQLYNCSLLKNTIMLNFNLGLTSYFKPWPVWVADKKQ